MTHTQVLVLAKTPVPGRVKTRLCPPCTPEQAARVAAAALADTLDTVTAARAARRILVVEGDHPAPPGWDRLAQRGGPLGERLANAFADAAAMPTVLVGMDTPQLSTDQLHEAFQLLGRAGAVLGHAVDGGWWLLGLRDPGDAVVLRDIVTSTPTTGAETESALLRRGLRVARVAALRDVDDAGDARAVAARCAPDGRFAHTVATEVPRTAGVPA
jgi:rSAM/selenodomain-associated transferase 1